MITTAQQAVLVTGATGFIGSHLVRRLVARGFRVSCLVRATSHVDELRAAGAQQIVCELEDRAGVSRVLAASMARFVFPLGGVVRALSAKDFMAVNAGGVDRVAAACAEQADRPVLVLVSSMAAAGPSGEIPKVESEPPVPVSDYGHSKLAGERAAARYARAVPITIVRPCVVFGAGDRGVYEVIGPIEHSGVHLVPGRGDRRVSLIAIPDVRRMHHASSRDRRTPCGRRPGTWYLFRCGGGSFACGARWRDRRGAREEADPCRPCAGMDGAGHWLWAAMSCRGLAAAPGLDRSRQDLRSACGLVDVFVRESASGNCGLVKPAAPLADRLRETAQWYPSRCALALIARVTVRRFAPSASTKRPSVMAAARHARARRLLKGSGPTRKYCGGRRMVLVGLHAMFESRRVSPPAGDLSVVGYDAKLDTLAVMLAGACANPPVPVVLSQTSGVADSGYSSDPGLRANATDPDLHATGAVESSEVVVVSASCILEHANSCSGNGVEGPDHSTRCG